MVTNITYAKLFFQLSVQVNLLKSNRIWSQFPDSNYYKGDYANADQANKKQLDPSWQAFHFASYTLFPFVSQMPQVLLYGWMFSVD